jgi:hypothetical protein
MQHLAASSRRSRALGTILVVALMILSFLAVLFATNVQAQSSECAGAEIVRTFTGTQGQTTEPFRIRGDKFRIAFDTERDGPNPRLEVTVFEDGQPTGESFVVTGEDSGSEIISLGPGTFQLEIQARNVDYDIDVDDCLGTSNAQVTTSQNQTTTAQDQTTTAQDQTTTAQDQTIDETTAADANLDASANRPDAENFRCELFLRVVRDDRGALRRQYRDDELIVQRFEQCISADVLADTIPDRKLPFTGGPSVPFGGGVLLLVAAVLAGRIIRR